MKPHNIRSTILSPGAVASELPQSITEPDVARAVSRLYDQALPADAFADMVIFAIGQPETVDVNEIIFRPTSQEF